jgi:hypothetical protein
MKSSIGVLFGLTLVLAFASSIPISENNWEGGSLIRQSEEDSENEDGNIREDSLIRQSGEDSENGDRAMEEGVYFRRRLKGSLWARPKLIPPLTK